MAADHAVPGALREALRSVAGDRAVVSPAVLWVHSPHRPSAHEAVEGVLADGAVVLDVLGSSAADPSRVAR
ncbi:hypothetical protein G4Z16_25660 [Streptomyces bathyalis]|uniref:Uncharacterized protein n=1 Tax=Streptomyces bathyalis TaxID=2710756 RepID=A0A7T1TAA2_9ACTN|nr:hypothetical protein [Streptomyces bathyalis]QPP09243.1 hypothetical protein G4Z16_25660 [Streptomyces bathyalis]